MSNGAFNINGGRADEYVVMVDGAVATRTRSSGSMLGALDVDTVQEVQVLPPNYSAEYGRSSSGQIRFVTKSGTRNLHGDLVENFRNSALDANTWTRNHSPLSADRQRRGALPFQPVRLRRRRAGIYPEAFQHGPQQAVLLSMPRNGSSGATRPPTPAWFPASPCATAISANC